MRPSGKPCKPSPLTVPRRMLYSGTTLPTNAGVLEPALIIRTLAIVRGIGCQSREILNDLWSIAGLKVHEIDQIIAGVPATASPAPGAPPAP